MLTSGILRPLRQTLGGLTSLTLHIETPAPRGTDAGNWEVPQMALPDASPFLAVVSNLQILKVVLVHVHPWFREPTTRTAFNCLFGECTLPQLRNLSLDWVALAESELLQLLLRSPQLETLVLDNLCALSGFQEHFPQNVQAIQPRMQFHEFDSYKFEVEELYRIVFGTVL